MLRPGNNIAGNAKQAHGSQTKEHTDPCVKDNRRALSEQFPQGRGSKVSIIVVVDGGACEPHIVGREMGTAHDPGNKSFIHKHFE